MGKERAMHTNKLSEEHSPYLLQHQHNPVDWLPWGEEAFAKAAKEEKPIFLSIGYSTCYWCHVMEKDSFEQEDVARVLNSLFVPIKVDREERPDVDAIYMEAVVRITGRGGWPMSVFLTPERKPFYGGTFFPREQFLTILQQLSRAWQEHRASIVDSANEMQQMIRDELAPGSSAPLDGTVFQEFITKLEDRFDAVHGGFGPAPKFPQGQNIAVLFRAALREPQKSSEGAVSAMTMAEKTLERMACGGMYDHLGGGFHRYSTDRKWLVPHFEKMLYDNAQLAMVYLEAFQVTGKDLYLSVARETLSYVQDMMTSDEGGFFSAEDAGEVGKEGEFYVWTEDELRSLLSDTELAEMKRLYGVTSLGNFEDGQNILHLQSQVLWNEKYDGHARAAITKMQDARGKRPLPHRDEKVLTSWNGLMISAFAQGYRVLGEPSYLRSAEASVTLIREKLMKDGELLHRRFRGESGIRGMLDDYAFFIQGLLDLLEAGAVESIGHEKFYRLALSLTEKAEELFWDEDTATYFNSAADDPTLIVRKRALYDGAEPSANAVMLKNHIRLSHLRYDARDDKRIQRMLETLAAAWQRSPHGFSTSLLAYDLFGSNVQELVIAGKKDDPEVAQLLVGLREKFLPHLVTVWAAEGAPPVAAGKSPREDGSVRFFLCEKGNCKQPVGTAAEVLQGLETKRS